MGGWLENWRVIPISAFNYVIVEVVAEIGNNKLWQLRLSTHNSVLAYAIRLITTPRWAYLVGRCKNQIS